MKIYVISLARSQERRQRMKEHMASHGVEFEFFDAVDGSLEHPLFADYDYKKRLWLTSGKMPTRGEMGCYASHYLLWLRCIEINQPIVVLEDDVILTPEFNKIISKLYNDTDSLGFIRLEPLIRGRSHEVYNDVLYRIFMMEDNFGGARGYAIAPKAAAKLIKHRWSLPVDCFIGLPYIHKMTSYVLSPAILEHDSKIETTFQTQASATKTTWYRKPTRELYTLYKKSMVKLYYMLTLMGMNK